MRKDAKIRARAKLLDFLGNPENDFVSRTDMSIKVLGYKKQNAIYNAFSPSELDDIEVEALELRKKRTVRQRANVLEALYKRAIGYRHPETKLNVVGGELVHTELEKIYPPDKAAAQEFLDRTEGKVKDKLDVNHSGSIETLSDVELDLKIKGLMEGLNASNGD